MYTSVDNAVLKQQLVAALIKSGLTAAQKPLSVANVVASALADMEDRLANGILVAQREATGVLARRASSLRYYAYAQGVYLARKRPAYTEVVLRRLNAKAPLVIPRYAAFSINGKPFYSRSEIYFAAGVKEVGGVNSGLYLYAGEIYSQNFQIQKGSDFARFQLAFGNFSVSDYDFVVRVNGKHWFPATKAIFEYGRQDQVYVAETLPSGHASVIFGNGLHMKRPAEDDVVTLTYAVVGGAKDNDNSVDQSITISTLPEVSGTTVSTVSYGENEPDPDTYRIIAPQFSRSGNYASSKSEHDAALCRFPNVADASALGQDMLVQHYGERYNHPAYMNMVVVAVLPKMGDALTQRQKAEFIEYAKTVSQPARDIQVLDPEPFHIDLDVNLYMWPHANKEKATASLETAIRALYQRGIGLLGRVITTSDYDACIDHAESDYAEFRNNSVNYLRPHQYPVLRSLVIRPYYTDRRPAS